MKEQAEPILFYNRGEPYYQFTNFFEASVEIDGKFWLTTEHYFQAQKFVATPYVEYIRRLSRAREAFEFARIPGVSRWRRNDWENVKIDIMKKALLAKFSQHPYLCRLLLDTRKRKLIEHSPHDSFWGDGGDGSGRNELGKLLMDIRTVLQSRPMKNWEEQNPQEYEPRKDSSVDECDRHKSKPVSCDNELPSSPTPPETMRTNHSEADGSNRTDENSVNQGSQMDTGDTLPHQTGEAAKKLNIPMQTPETVLQYVQPPATASLQPQVGEQLSSSASAPRYEASPLGSPKCKPATPLNNLSSDSRSNTAGNDNEMDVDSPS